ncbi:MAG: class I SAM-dependent methyltransferase family protein [Candidatus Diapherotrites archaeon]|nr:class I SAM-dependent methyltransferase family protein [Candidatus Diapherotrites archaeon]
MPSLALRVERKKASALHAFLKESALLVKELEPASDEFHVFFPVKKLSAKDRKIIKEKFAAIVVEKTFKKKSGSRKTFKEILSGRLSRKDLALVGRAFDLVGNIAIVEIPNELKGNEKIIGTALLEAHKNLETVCMKTGAHKGVFRAEPVKVIAGKKNLVATYTESGCVFRVSLGKVFFSPRLAAERLRISRQVKKGEVVAALFAGVGPFPIVLAKKTRMSKAYAVELNPVAVKDMQENVKKNRVGEKVAVLSGDVKKIVPRKLAGKCDRVLMPLPKGAEEFLHEAFLCLKKEGGIIHFYGFAERSNLFEPAIRLIKSQAEKIGKKVKILYKSELRSYSPQTAQIVIDFSVS